jgi:uncharacterized membrane protein YccC
VEDAALGHAEELVWMLRELADGAAETVAGFRTRTGFHPPVPAAGQGHSWLRPVRENLSSRSVLLRHALRVGITTALSVALAAGFGLQYGYWIPLTVLFVLQPSTGLTVVRGLQRVLGTVLGGVLAALIPFAVTEPAGLLAVVFVLAAATVATWPVNYALFAFFVTPTFVLLAELESGVGSLYQERIAYTIVGGVLALTGAWIFWSLPERRQFPAHMAAALRAAADYLRVSADAAAGRTSDEFALPRLRRAAGLALINAGESLQRLIVELGDGAAAVEASRSMLVHLRRLVAATAGLSTVSPSPEVEPGVVQRFGAAAADTLVALADVIADHRPQGATPLRLEPVRGDPLLRLQFQRIDRSLRLIHATATRFAGAEGLVH